MTTLNSKLRLQLLANKKLQRCSGKGFTLIELMVTVGVLGALAAAAFPAFTGAQAKASAGAIIGSMQGYAKECATKAITGDQSGIASGETAITGMTFSSGTGTALDCSDGEVITSDTFDETKIGGLKCGASAAGAEAVADGTDDNICTLTITSDGVITGAWSVEA